jgi:hypothetical protein
LLALIGSASFSDVAAAAGTRRSALAIALHYGTGPRAMGLKLSDRKQTPNNYATGKRALSRRLVH